MKSLLFDQNTFILINVSKSSGQEGRRHKISGNESLIPVGTGDRRVACPLGYHLLHDVELADLGSGVEINRL